MPLLLILKTLIISLLLSGHTPEQLASTIHTKPVEHSLYKLEVTYQEIKLYSLSLSNSHAVGADGINIIIIIKSNINYLAHLLVYIFNLSFKQGFSPTIKRR